MSIALVRHGLTSWNDAGRMQGRADIGLSDAGRAQVRAWTLPARFKTARFVSSPLARARETAALLGGDQFAVDEALIEMHWGAWEGETHAALRERDGARFELASARGLDFRPPGGESPRDVQQRMRSWLASRANAPYDVVAITHQGVIRAVLALLSGWDMTGKPPVRLHDDVAHVIDVDGERLRATWNVPLVEGPLRRRRAGPATSDRQGRATRRDQPPPPDDR